MDDQCKYNTYTCFIYNQLWFIDHPKNTLSYSIFHILKSIQISHKFNSVLPLNFSSSNHFSYANQISYANQFSYALKEFNLCLRYTGYQSHRHGPAGPQAGITWFYNIVRSRWLLTGYKQSNSEHYRYGPAGLLIGVTHQYNSSQYCYLTLLVY